MGHREFNGAQHLGGGLADAEPADGVAIKIELSQSGSALGP